MLTYEEWFDLVEDTLRCLFAENGSDREMSFDEEYEFGKAYDAYLITYRTLTSDNGIYHVFEYNKCFIPLWESK